MGILRTDKALLSRDKETPKVNFNVLNVFIGTGVIAGVVHSSAEGVQEPPWSIPDSLR